MHPWQLGNTIFNWGDRTYLMGVLNVTPDSFSDGGEFHSLNHAIAQAVEMVNAGVDIIDIGGESTRPGSEAVSQAEEIDRVVPVIVGIRQHSRIGQIPISIDTTKAAVARAAVAAGADVINDISGATFDPEMLATIAQLNVPAILMHIRGNPKNMQQLTDYDDLLGEIIQFLKARIDSAVAAGCDRNQISIDPGIGFAKTFRAEFRIATTIARICSAELSDANWRIPKKFHWAYSRTA